MKKQRFLLTLMMTIVMMAMSPQKMWAGYVTQVQKIGDMDATNQLDIAYITVDGDDCPWANVDNGTEVTFHAKTVEGLTFTGWYEYYNYEEGDIIGECVSTEYDYTTTSNEGIISLAAVYTKNEGYNVIYAGWYSLFNSEEYMYGNGKISFADGNKYAVVKNGTAVSLTAVPLNGSGFKCWTLDSYNESGEYTPIDNAGQNYSFTATKDTTLYAVFEYTGNYKPVLYRVKLSDGTSIDSYTGMDYKGEYVGTVESYKGLPSEDNPVVKVYASYWDAEDADCSYTCQYTPNEDGSVLMTINLTNANGTCVYKITVNQVMRIFAESNYNDRGSVSAKAGKEDIPLDEYGEVDCTIPYGSEVTFTATANDGCEFVKWMKWVDEEDRYVNCDLPNPFTTIESIRVKAVFSSPTMAEVVVYGAGPVDGIVKDAEGKVILDEDHYRCEVAKNVTVTFLPSMYNLAEGELPGLRFVGWYDDDTEECVSTKEKYTMSVTADTYLYAKYANDVTTTNGWASYYDGFNDFTVKGGKAYIAEYVEDSDGKGTPAVNLISLEGKVSGREAILVRDTDGDNKVTLTYAHSNSDETESNKLYGHNGYKYDEGGYGYDYYLDEEYEDGTFYGLYNKEKNVEFRRYLKVQSEDFMLPAHKAVLWLEKEYSGGLAAKLNVFIDGEEADVATSMEITKALSSDAMYDLSGCRVQSPRKGLYIKNGKKMMVK